MPPPSLRHSNATFVFFSSWPHTSSTPPTTAPRYLVAELQVCLFLLIRTRYTHGMYRRGRPARNAHTRRRRGTGNGFARRFGHARGSIAPCCWERHASTTSMVATGVDAAMLFYAWPCHAPFKGDLRAPCQEPIRFDRIFARNHPKVPAGERYSLRRVDAASSKRGRLGQTFDRVSRARHAR